MGASRHHSSAHPVGPVGPVWFTEKFEEAHSPGSSLPTLGPGSFLPQGHRDPHLLACHVPDAPGHVLNRCQPLTSEASNGTRLSPLDRRED